MSLLDDTIRDAHRPLTVGRPVSAPKPAMHDPVCAGDAADLPDRSVAFADRADPGNEIWAVARKERACRDDFQREGQSMSREASYPSGSGIRRLPTGDPLSAGMGAERPKSSAKNVGMTDVTVMGDSRTSELATGPEEGRSPGKVAAAAASSESKSHQSEVLPGPIEAEWSRARSMSMTPEGSKRTVSAYGETFLSRPSGRGAPSENPWAATLPAPQTVRTAMARAPTAMHAATPRTDEGDEVVDAPMPVRTSGRHPPVADLAARAPTQSSLSSPARRAADERAAIDASSPAGRRGAAPSGDVASTLSIGRIDVTVLADGVQAVAASTSEPLGDAGFFACNYLKRL